MESTQKYQYFNGIKFTRDDKTGYYLASTIRKRIHRYVWEFYNGEIPKGYCIHHIDHDKSNNSIDNLMLIKIGEHSCLHSNEFVQNHYDRIIKNLEINAREKASEWHRSESGREWHKKHYEETKHKMKEKRNFVCLYCGKNFSSEQARSKFCSNKCKSAYRRKSGVDNVEKKCIVCGTTFLSNKYENISTCSLACRSKYAYSKRKK